MKFEFRNEGLKSKFSLILFVYGPVHTYPYLFENATFLLRFPKNLRPLVAFSPLQTYTMNRFENDNLPDLACVASVLSGFGAEKDRGRGSSVFAAREVKRKAKNERGGRGRGRNRPLFPLFYLRHFSRGL